MYKCEECKKTQSPRIPQILLVTEDRNKVYPPSPECKDRGGTGWEIVKTKKICPTCNTNIQEKS